MKVTMTMTEDEIKDACLLWLGDRLPGGADRDRGEFLVDGDSLGGDLAFEITVEAPTPVREGSPP